MHCLRTMIDPVTEAANCELVSSPDGSVTEVVVKPDPIKEVQAVTCAGVRESANVQAAIQHIADAPHRNAVVTIERPLTTYPGEKRLSPSKYRSCEISPAYEGDPTQPEHPLTVRGKVMHAALETGDDSKLEAGEHELVDMCRTAEAALIPAKATRFREMRFPIVGADYGFADLVAISGDVGYVLDYKFAFNKQEDAETNPQVQAYALGLASSFTYLTKIHVDLLYPRLDIVDSATFTRSDLPRIRARIMAIKKRHDIATPATCKYHESTCTWCRHLATCPTAAKALLPIATRYGESHATPLPNIDFAAITDPNQWARLLQAAPVFEAVADSIRRHAQEFCKEHGDSIPGYTLTEVSGKRSIVSPALAHEIASGEFGITTENFLRAVKVSATDLLDIAKETAPRGQKGKRAQELEDRLRDAGVLTVGSDFYQLRKVKS